VQFWAHVGPEGVALLEAAWRAGRVTATGERHDVSPGLRAISRRRSFAGQQILVVETASGEVVLASDAFISTRSSSSSAPSV